MELCSTDLQLDTSTNGLKQVYTSTQEIYEKTYFLENVHLKIIYNIYKFLSQTNTPLKNGIFMSKIVL